MANSNKDIIITGFVAGADLRTHRYKVVKITAGLEDQPGTVGLSDSQGEACLGVLQNAPNTGETAEVLVSGRTPMVASNATITAGNMLVSEGNGTAEAAASGDYVFGQALEDAAANAQFDALVEFKAQGKA